MLVALDGDRASVKTGDQKAVDDLLETLGLQEPRRSRELLVDRRSDELFD